MQCSDDYDPYPHATDYYPVLVETKPYTQDQMRDVINKNIINTRKLEVQLLEAHTLLNEIYLRTEQLPYGISQKIREVLTK